MSVRAEPKAVPHTTLTPNQVVAYNLQFARAARGWTQAEASEQLEKHLGPPRWSRATFSAAERSVGGKRVREFTADEIVAFARTFDLPLGWFFMPPHHDPWRRIPYEPPERTTMPPVSADVLVERAYPLPKSYDANRLDDRVAGCWPQLSPETRARYEPHVARALRGLYPDAPLAPIDPDAQE